MICILSMLPVMAAAAMAPILGRFAELYPASPDLTIRMILTLPQLLIIPGSLLSGRLASRVSKKTLLIIGLALYSAGGLSGGISSSINQLLASRAVLGIGIGIIFPLTTSLVPDYFSGEGRIRMLGLSAAMNNLGGVIATLSSGLLVSLSWRAPFLIYLTAAAAMVLVITVLPSYRAAVGVQEEQAVRPYRKVLPFLLGILGLNLIFYTIPSTTSMTIRDLDLGGPVYCGIMLATQNLCSFAAGTVFKHVYLKFRARIRYLSMGIISTGFLLFILFPKTAVLPVSLILIGSGYGLLTPYYLLRVSLGTTPGRRTFALSLASCSMFLGQFLNPVVLSLIGKGFGLEMPTGVSLVMIIPFVLLMGLFDLRDRRSEGHQG